MNKTEMTRNSFNHALLSEMPQGIQMKKSILFPISKL